jgi:hypothetical protein
MVAALRRPARYMSSGAHLLRAHLLLVMRAAVVLCAASCALAALLALSCQGSVEHPVASTKDTGGTGFHLDTAAYDLPDSLQGQVARRLGGCLGSEAECHGGTGNPAHLFLGNGPEQDLAQLVSVRSTERPDLFRVAPFDPAHSWMLLKLQNATDAGVETAMPKGSDGDPELATLVSAWIVAGAPTDLKVDAGADAD